MGKFNTRNGLSSLANSDVLGQLSINGGGASIPLLVDGATNRLLTLSDTNSAADAVLAVQDSDGDLLFEVRPSGIRIGGNYQLPLADSSFANYFLKSNAAGTVSWANPFSTLTLSDITDLELSPLSTGAVNGAYLRYDSVNSEWVADGPHAGFHANRQLGTITKGTPVRRTGSGQGGGIYEMGVGSTNNDYRCVGIAFDAQDASSRLIVMTDGLIGGLDTSSYSTDDILYVSNTTGQLTATAPTSGLYQQRVARVVASDATNGVIQVTVDPNFDEAEYLENLTSESLGSLSDVTITSVASGEVLQYNGAEWENASLNTTVVVDVHNNSGADITKGTPVYVSGEHASGKPTIALADNDGSGTYPAIGLVQADITDGTDGNVVLSGPLLNLNTSSYTAGDALYIDSTAGALTSTRPTSATEAVQKVALVTRSHATSGSVVVMGAGRVNDIPNDVVLDDLDGVDLTTTAPTTNDFLQYNGTSWVPAAPTLDSVTDNGSSTTNDITVGAIESFQISGVDTGLTLHAEDGGTESDWEAIAIKRYVGNPSFVNDGHSAGAINWYHSDDADDASKDFHKISSIRSNITDGTDASIDGSITMFTTVDGTQTEALHLENGTIKVAGSFTLPDADGTNGQTLVTDGSGNVSWGSGVGSANLEDLADMDTNYWSQDINESSLVQRDGVGYFTGGNSGILVYCSAALTKGQPLEASGGASYNPDEDMSIQATPCDNNDGDMCIGIACETKSASASNKVVAMTNGMLSGLNTTQYGSAGTKIYIDTDGSLTNTAPSTGRVQHVATVLFSDSTDGAIWVHINNAVTQAGTGGSQTLDETLTEGNTTTQSMETGAITATVSDLSAPLTLVTTSDLGALWPSIEIKHESTTPANNDNIGSFKFTSSNDADEEMSMAEMRVVVEDVTDGSEKSQFKFYVRDGGSQTLMTQISDDGLYVAGSGSFNGLSSTTSTDDYGLITTRTASGATDWDAIQIGRVDFTYASNRPIGSMVFNAFDTGNSLTTAARVTGVVMDTTASSVDGALDFYTTENGTETRRVRVDNDNVTIGEGSTFYTLPLERGSNNQVLLSGASGTVTWQDMSMDNLSNVTIVSPSGNQILKYDPVDQRWENGPVPVPTLAEVTAAGASTTTTLSVAQILQTGAHVNVATSGNWFSQFRAKTLEVGATTGSLAYTLPTAAGTDGQVITMQSGTNTGWEDPVKTMTFWNQGIYQMSTSNDTLYRFSTGTSYPNYGLWNSTSSTVPSSLTRTPQRSKGGHIIPFDITGATLTAKVGFAVGTTTALTSSASEYLSDTINFAVYRWPDNGSAVLIDEFTGTINGGNTTGEEEAEITITGVTLNEGDSLQLVSRCLQEASSTRYMAINYTFHIEY